MLYYNELVRATDTRDLVWKSDLELQGMVVCFGRYGIAVCTYVFPQSEFDPTSIQSPIQFWSSNTGFRKSIPRKQAESTVSLAGVVGKSRSSSIVRRHQTLNPD